eukprot:TRINITY_DN1558_c1_g1_i1.p1 TRINITY_DN1558_c1_g1~~TRINITY_DN1558_c1_g1_i1.p1  ORF type:complete len:316 (+),score=34.28 TRINITY_DN1558_c1_g1_i1:75-1022(+)
MEAKPMKWAPKSKPRGVAFTEDYVSESMREEERDVCQVSSSVYISSYKGANAVDKLRREGITRVLSVGCDLKPLHPEAFEYKIITVDDATFTDLLSWTPVGVDYIDGGEGGCLVHCEKGMSRSAFMVIAHGMVKKGMSLVEAFCEVKRSRDMVRPNEGFCRQLRFLETILATGNAPCEGSIFTLYQAESNILKDLEYSFEDTTIRVDPITYCQPDRSPPSNPLKGLFCPCSRIIASPLNFLAPSIFEIPSWASVDSTTITCPDCSNHVGTTAQTPQVLGIPPALLPERVLKIRDEAGLVFRPIKIKDGGIDRAEA